MLNGIRCESERASIRSRSARKLALAIFNGTAVVPDVYQWGFFFKLTSTMLTMTGTLGDLSLVRSEPQYNGGKRMI